MNIRHHTIVELQMNNKEKEVDLIRWKTVNRIEESSRKTQTKTKNTQSKVIIEKTEYTKK